MSRIFRNCFLAILPAGTISTLTPARASHCCATGRVSGEAQKISRQSGPTNKDKPVSSVLWQWSVARSVRSVIGRGLHMEATGVLMSHGGLCVTAIRMEELLPTQKPSKTLRPPHPATTRTRCFDSPASRSTVMLITTSPQMAGDACSQRISEVVGSLSFCGMRWHQYTQSSCILDTRWFCSPSYAVNNHCHTIAAVQMATLADRTLFCQPG